MVSRPTVPRCEKVVSGIAQWRAGKALGIRNGEMLLSRLMFNPRVIKRLDDAIWVARSSDGRRISRQCRSYTVDRAEERMVRCPRARALSGRSSTVFVHVQLQALGP